MHLTIDIGNTTTKVALFPPNEDRDARATTPVAFQKIDGHDIAHLRDFIRPFRPQSSIVSSTIRLTPQLRSDIESLGTRSTCYLDHNTPIPIRNRYSTPETLGADRLAAAIGAYFECKHIRGSHKPTLVVDMGTAITYDFITEGGEYIGGNISPGVEMRLRALHEFTSQLPLVAKDGPHPPIGLSTETAIRCGVLDGVKHEVQGYIRQHLARQPQLLVFLTGGDNIDFEEQVKKCTFADNLLVSKGLNNILQHIARCTQHKDQ